MLGFWIESLYPEKDQYKEHDRDADPENHIQGFGHCEGYVGFIFKHCGNNFLYTSHMAFHIMDISEYCDMIDAIIIILDKDGRIIFANRKSCNLLGFTRQDLIGRDWFREFLPEEEKNLMHSYKKYIDGGLPDLKHHDNPVKTKRGTRNIRWFNTLVRKDGKVIGVFSSGQDLADPNLAAELNKIKLLEDVMKNIMDIVAIIDAKGKILYESPSVETELGYRPEELVGLQITALVHPDDLKLAGVGLKNCLSEGKEQLVLRFRHKDGHYISLEGRGRVRKDGNIIMTSRDISDRVGLENSLKRAQEMSGLGRWQLDHKSGRLTWSDAIYRIFEKDRKRFGASYDAFLAAVHPADREKVDKAFTDSLRNKTDYEIIHRLLMKDGRIKHVREICKTAFDDSGRPLVSEGTVQEITELKNAEEALKESESRYRMIADHLNDGLYMHDFRGNIVDVNENACRMLGYSKEELIAGGLELIDDEKNRALVKQRMQELIEKGILIFEGTHVRKDRTSVDVAISARVITMEGKGLAQSMVRDITQSKRAIKEMSLLNESLSKRNEELETFHNLTVDRELRMIELKKRIEQLEKKLKDKGMSA
jgi:PAS domain S-box-containing protein